MLSRLLCSFIVIALVFKTVAKEKQNYHRRRDNDSKILYSKVMPKARKYYEKKEYKKAISILENYIAIYTPKNLLPHSVLILYHFKNKDYLEAATLGEELAQVMSLQSFNQLRSATVQNFSLIAIYSDNIIYSIESYRRLNMPIQSKILKQKMRNIIIRVFSREENISGGILEEFETKDANMQKYGSLRSPKDKDAIFF